MPDEELIKIVDEQISKLAKTGGRSHTMTVPPRVDDTDMILSELLRRYKLTKKMNYRSKIQDLISKYQSQNEFLLKKKPELEVRGDFTDYGVKLASNNIFIDDLKTILEDEKN